MRYLAVLALACSCGDDGRGPAPDGGGTASLEPSDESGVAINELTFSTTSVGQQEGASFQVRNRGTITTGPIAVSIQGDHANDFVIDNAATTCAAVRLEPQDACEVVLAFRPTAAGDRVATLHVASDPGGTAMVALIGTALMPVLHFEPPNLSFGTLQIGDSAQAIVALRNDGTGAAPVDALEVTGAGFSRSSTTCTDVLEPGASCDVVVLALPQMLGDATGNLTVTSGAQGYTAALFATGARRIDVVRGGSGTGTVTSSPAGIDCGSTCSGLFTTDVTFTAVPGSNAEVTSWSIPGCGQAPTCVVPADVAPIDVQVTFSLVGSSELQISFAGDAPGDVDVARRTSTGTTRTRCFASCSVPIDPGDELEVSAATASLFGGLSGACSTSPGSGSCSFTAPVGVSVITATFTKHPDELWTRFLPDPIIQVATDTAGNVIAATPAQITKYTSAGNVVWTRNLPVSALATGPADTIYVVSGTDLKKLDANGDPLWTRALDAGTQTTCGSVLEPEQCLAVGADGAVAVHGPQAAARWDVDGNPSWTKAVSGGAPGIAIDPTGIVYVTTFEAGDGLDARRFQPDGTELVKLDRVANQAHGELAIDSEGRLLSTSSGRGNTHFKRHTSSGAFDYAKLFEGFFASYLPNGLAPSSSGRIGWWYFTEDLSGTFEVRVFSNAGLDMFTMTRERFVTPQGKVGVVALDAAFSSDQLVLAGRYGTFGGTLGWLQAFAP